MTITEQVGNVVRNIGYAVRDPRPGPILVTNGTGVVSYRVALRLIEAGFPTVKVGSPEPDSLAGLEKAGAEIVRFDWEDTTTYNFEGIKTVFISIPHIEDGESKFAKFMKKAVAAGVKHFIKLSFVHAFLNPEYENKIAHLVHMSDTPNPFLNVPLVHMHRACDSLLMKTHHIDYTILFASHLMSDPAVFQGESIAKSHEFFGASHGRKVNYVSPNDVADVAVRAMLAPKEHSCVGYTLTGPVPVADTAVAKLLGTHLNAPVMYKDMTLHDYATKAKENGDWGPAWDVAYMEMAKASGIEAEEGFSKCDVKRVCGHRSETFEEYLLAKDRMTPQELKFLVPCPTVDSQE